MNPIKFHEKLAYLSQADDPQDLANRILGGPQKDILHDSDTTEKVSMAIKEFLKDNVNNLGKSDLLALKNLQGLFGTLRQTWTKADLQETNLANLTTLEKIMAFSITLANKDIHVIKPGSTLSLEDQLSKPDNYGSFATLIKLNFLQPVVNTNIMKEAINKASKEDVVDFIDEVFKKQNSNRLEFKQMISTFFQHASPEKQAMFFSSINDEKLLSHIIDIMPKNMTNLDLGACLSFKDHHLKKIKNHLSNLQTINLSQCKSLSPAAIEAMGNLNAGNKM